MQDLFREMLRLTKSGMRGFAIRAKLSPNKIVTDSLAIFASLENQTRPLRVTFEGEKAADSGGVTTSLYRRFFAEILADSTYFERRFSFSFLDFVVFLKCFVVQRRILSPSCKCAFGCDEVVWNFHFALSL